MSFSIPLHKVYAFVQHKADKMQANLTDHFQYLIILHPFELEEYCPYVGAHKVGLSHEEILKLPKSKILRELVNLKSY